MNQEFWDNNKQILEILDIEEEELKINGNFINKNQFGQLVDERFNMLARKYHPDFGGDVEKFKKILKAKEMLFENSKEHGEVVLNINKMFESRFDKGSRAAKFGDQIFHMLKENSETLKLTIKSKPVDSDDFYEWRFHCAIINEELCVNVLDVEEDNEELTGEKSEGGLIPLVVCIFIPSTNMTVTKSAYDGSVGFGFNDKVLIETSNSDVLISYLSDPQNIYNDLVAVKENRFEQKYKKEIYKSKTPKESFEKDQKVREYLTKFNIFKLESDPDASKVLDDFWKVMNDKKSN